MQKVVNIEANISLKSSIIFQDIDSHCSKDHCPSQNTFAKVQNHGLIAKKSKPKKSRSKQKFEAS